MEYNEKCKLEIRRDGYIGNVWKLCTRNKNWCKLFIYFVLFFYFYFSV